MTVVLPDHVVEFLAPISIRQVYGVGPKTADRLKEMGLETIAEVQRSPRENLVETLGAFGEYLYDVAFGRDAGEVVEPTGPPESISTETTFAKDLEAFDGIWPELEDLAMALHAQLLSERYAYRTVSLKVKYSDFEIHTRSKSLKVDTTDLEPILVLSQVLLRDVLLSRRKVRLVGVRLSNLSERPAPQATLARWVSVPPPVVRLVRFLRRQRPPGERRGDQRPRGHEPFRVGVRRELDDGGLVPEGEAFRHRHLRRRRGRDGGDYSCRALRRTLG